MVAEVEKYSEKSSEPLCPAEKELYMSGNDGEPDENSLLDENNPLIMPCPDRGLSNGEPGDKLDEDDEECRDDMKESKGADFGPLNASIGAPTVLL